MSEDLGSLIAGNPSLAEDLLRLGEESADKAETAGWGAHIVRVGYDGFRYKLHDRSLPGKPDIVLPKYHAVILVHGCFWHFHGCHLSKVPTTRTDWWLKKLERTRLQRLAEQ